MCYYLNVQFWGQRVNCNNVTCREMYVQPGSSRAAAGPKLLHSQFLNVNFPTFSRKTPYKGKKYLSLSPHFYTTQYILCASQQQTYNRTTTDCNPVNFLAPKLFF